MSQTSVPWDSKVSLTTSCEFQPVDNTNIFSVISCDREFAQFMDFFDNYWNIASLFECRWTCAILSIIWLERVNCPKFAVAASRGSFCQFPPVSVPQLFKHDFHHPLWWATCTSHGVFWPIKIFQSSFVSSLRGMFEYWGAPTFNRIQCYQAAF